MQATSSEAEENRFVVLVTWRREQKQFSSEAAAWRGFARRLESDGSQLSPVWFRKIEDLGGIMKQILPPHCFTRDNQIHRNLKPED
jgi:hypothetical protein